MEKKVDSLKSSIESFILGIVGVKEYHAQIVTGAIIELLREEGFITIDGESNASEKQD